MDLLTVATELYGLLPGEFVKTRNARAKEARADGDRDLADDIADLTKPSVAAWAVNQLVRHKAELVEQMIDLGTELRGAQHNLDRDDVRQLNAQRQQLTGVIARQAAELGEQLGQRVSASALDEVQQTLHAAMADSDAADAVRTGRLLRSLESTGFEAADLDGAVAAPEAGGEASTRSSRGAAAHSKGASTSNNETTAKVTSRDEVAARRDQKERERRQREARDAVARAERAHRDASREAASAARRADVAEQHAADAAHRATEAASRRARLSDDRDRLERELRDVLAQLDAAKDALAEAQRGAATASDEREAAQQQAAAADDALTTATHELELARQQLNALGE